MPIYTYRCRECGHEFDKMQKMSDPAVDDCEKCGKPVSRVFHPVGIIFKGSGFYKTDNAKKGNGERGKGKVEELSAGETKKETVTETKKPEKKESSV